MRRRAVGQLAVVVDVADAGEVLVGQDRAGSSSWRTQAGPGAKMLPWGPSRVPIEVTSSSRMASRGGFVTWANSWEK